MGLKLITPPATQPITLVEAKAHLRVVDTDEDTLINAMIAASTANVEGWTGRALIDQTWEFVSDSFPTLTQGFVYTSTGQYAIQIPKPPLIEVLDVKYDDSNGDEQTMDVADYFVDNVNEPGWIVPIGTSGWPSTIAAINAVRIRFRAGYLSTDSPPVAAVPEDIKAALKLTLGSLYEHREEQVVGSIASKLPFGVEQLLRRHRVLLGMA